MLDIYGSLSTLINLSGKMRMLSHRAAMGALLWQIDEKDRSSALQMFDAALDEFKKIRQALVSGEDGTVLPEATSFLKQQGSLTSTMIAPLESFLLQAQTLRTQLGAAEPSASDIRSFSNFVGNELLAALNKLTAAISACLDSLIAKDRAAKTENARALADAANAIGNVSRKVKLISLNATIEAARAGDAGRAFGVIANEISTLSAEASQYSEKLVQQIAS